jgi:glyoxylase-like metal-dependent hydrolase (beta-lactamase superfamily II)
MIDGNEIKIIVFNCHGPAHAFAWIASDKTVLCGVVLSENMHLWMADNQTSESRMAWIKTLENMIDLKPNRVIAGHVLGDAKRNIDVVHATKNYVSGFDDSDKKSDSAT